MSKIRYRKKPVVIDAAQWFKNGDHPRDESIWMDEQSRDSFLREGRVVRRYRRPDDDGKSQCKKCGRIMHNHGWIDTLEGGHIVCPGDWVITGVQGEKYPCKDEIFQATYEPIRTDGQKG